MNSSFSAPPSSVFAELLQGAVQACLQAQQQGHDDRAGGRQQPAFGHRQAAEQEGHQQRDFGGHAVVAAALRIDQVAGDHQQGEHHEQGDPHRRAEMQHAECRQPAEQAAEAEGAQPGDQFAVGVLAVVPAAFGADQQADTQGGGEVE
ncbi:hypothetical protein SSTU70S_01734 [Stutzerimonas stutzeri]